MEIIPNPQVMIVVFVVFMVTMFFLNKFVFKPVISHMDERERKVRSDLELADKEDGELQQIEREINKILSEAKAHAIAEKEHQIQEAKQSANAKIERVQIENRERMDSFMAKLQGSKEEMKENIRSSLGDVHSLVLSKIKHT